MLMRVLCGMLAAIALCAGAGCEGSGENGKMTYTDAIKTAKELGVEADVNIQQGDGNFLGFVFNFLGAHWNAHLRVRPNAPEAAGGQPGIPPGTADPNLRALEELSRLLQSSIDNFRNAADDLAAAARDVRASTQPAGPPGP